MQFCRLAMGVQLHVPCTVVSIGHRESACSSNGRFFHCLTRWQYGIRWETVTVTKYTQPV